MQNVTRRFFVAFLLVLIAVGIIVLAGIAGVGKKIGAPGLDVLISEGVGYFLDSEGTGPFPETTSPQEMEKIVGTWSGVSDVGGTEWRFLFEQNYAVRVRNSAGYFHQGTAFVHWKLGLTDGALRVPPGWSPLDVDVIQSSDPSYQNNISLGAFSRRREVLHYCFNEPGKMVRPIADESREGIRCFELTKAEADADMSAGPPLFPSAQKASRSSSVSPPARNTREEGTERIIDVQDFHATILVHDDGAFTVHETMQIFTNGVTFGQKRPHLLSGIYRSIGSRIQGRHAYYRIMAFEMIGATLDGEPIPYEVETSGSWFVKYVFFGPDGLSLSPGIHEVALDYKTDRHMNFLTDHDEFFWWVFGEGGHGWATSVRKAAVTVVLPEGSYGIIAGLDDHSWNRGTGNIPDLLRRAEVDGTNVLQYSKELTPKKPYLSVVVSMPKGTVREPDMTLHTIFFFRDMNTYLPGLIGLTVFFLYYLVVWMRVGRDPEKKAVVPLYRPPANCSPAVARFLSTMGYDRTGFACALLSLASKGVIGIFRRDAGYFVEKTAPDRSRNSPDEQVLFDAFFGSGGKEAALPKWRELDAAAIHRSYRKHRRHLVSAAGKRFFRRNALYVIPGILISLIVAAINAEIVDVEGSYVKELAGLGLWTVFAGFICRFLARKNVLELRKPSRLVWLVLLFPAVLYSIAVAVSHASEVFNIMQFMFLLPLFIMATAHVVFLFLLRAPTPLGRKVMDEIEGFRTFLAAAEGDRLDRMTPPEKTPALYQAYLPYALALGVENRWSEQFSGMIDETYTLPPLDLFLATLSRLFSAKR